MFILDISNNQQKFVIICLTVAFKNSVSTKIKQTQVLQNYNASLKVL